MTPSQPRTGLSERTCALIMIRFVQAGLRLPALIMVLLLKGYKKCLSPYMAPACRFYPTCSVYAMEVYSTFGFMKGSWLTFKRLLKCHPFHGGGVDLPPSRTPKNPAG